MRDYVVIIVMKESNRKQVWNGNIKHVNGDEQGSQDVLQSIHGQFFTLLGLLVKHITSILRPKGSFETYHYIR